MFISAVDGAEIRRAPVEVGSWNPIISMVSDIPGGAGFQPSTVSLRSIRIFNPGPIYQPAKLSLPDSVQHL